MTDAIVKFTTCNLPSGALDHYEVSFTIDPASLTYGFIVLPGELANPHDLNEVKAVAIMKATAQKVQESLVRVDDPSMIGPVTL
ncbi:MAG: hypothetical protein ACREBR_05545 [bacterium]